eukprot:753148-Hanusia_phi.AAC.1
MEESRGHGRLGDRRGTEGGGRRRGGYSEGLSDRRSDSLLLLHLFVNPEPQRFVRSRGITRTLSLRKEGSSCSVFPEGSGWRDSDDKVHCTAPGRAYTTAPGLTAAVLWHGIQLSL